MVVTLAPPVVVKVIDELLIVVARFVIKSLIGTRIDKVETPVGTYA